MLTRSFVVTSLSALVLTVLFSAPVYAAPKTGFQAFIVGNPADAQQSPTLSPGLVLMGGGTDVDAAFQWMCQRAGGGDFVVIRTTGTDAYNPYIQQLCPQMDSVETIIITSVTGANSAYVSSHIQNAEALWIAGGDQSTYVALWRGTAVETGVNHLLNSVQYSGIADRTHAHRKAGDALHCKTIILIVEISIRITNFHAKLG